MSKFKRGLGLAAASLALTASAYGAQAQENQSEAVIGPPQLKDFTLQPRDRPATQPTPSPATEPPVAQSPAPAPAPQTPPEAAPRPQSPVADRPGSPDNPAPARRTAPQAAPTGVAPALPSMPVPEPSGSTAGAPPMTFPVEDPSPSAVPADPIAEASPAAPGTSWWMVALPAATLFGLVGFFLLRTRRRAGDAASVEEAPPIPAPAPVPAPAPRVAPIPRPWLELSLKAERATFTDEEAEIQFELEISNKGGSAARNLRIDVKMFSAGAEQDKEIGVFFKTAGRETTKLRLPGVEAGVTGVIRGSVGMKREEIRAMRLDERLLFIPVVAVNALYDYDAGRTGQTSRSYLVGREAQQANEKMGPFRVDQGPRIWRTVGQRPHKLSKRV